jgi:hypothetical protein
MGGVNQPKIEGFYANWAMLRIILSAHDGPDFKTQDFAALDWDHSLEGEPVPGTGPLDVGEAMGPYKKGASVSMYLEKALEFQKILMAIGAGRGLGFMQVRFDIVCNYEPVGQADPLIYTVTIPGCRIMTESLKAAPGAAPSLVEMPLSVSGVIEKRLPDGTLLTPVVINNE